MKLALGVVLLLGCSSSLPPLPKAAPVRAVTPGDDLLDILPAGADAVAELDVARIRENGAVAGVVGAVRKMAVSGFDPLGTIDVAVAAVYRMGHDDAVTLFVLRGAALDLPASIRAGGELLDEHTFVYAPKEDRYRFHDFSPRMRGDVDFMSLRARAMPERAAGSVVRITARLDQAARISAAGKLGVDELPSTVSAWLDVADDAAFIAFLGGDDEADAVRLAAGVKAAAARAEHFLPRWYPRGGDLSAKTTGRVCKVVWTFGPHHLDAWAKATEKRLSREGS